MVGAVGGGVQGVSSRAELCTVLHHPRWRQQDKDESSSRVLLQTGAETRGQVRRGGPWSSGPGWPAVDLLLSAICEYSIAPGALLTCLSLLFTLSCLSDRNRIFTLLSQVKMLLDFIALLFFPEASHLWGDNGCLREAVSAPGSLALCTYLQSGF